MNENWKSDILFWHIETLNMPEYIIPEFNHVVSMITLIKQHGITLPLRIDRRGNVLGYYEYFTAMRLLNITLIPVVIS